MDFPKKNKNKNKIKKDVTILKMDAELPRRLVASLEEGPHHYIFTRASKSAI